SGYVSTYFFAGSDAWKPTLLWVPSHIGFELEWPHRHSAILGFPVVSTFAPVGSYSSTSPSTRYGPFGRAVILTGMGRVLLVGFACAPQPTTEAYTERVKEPGGILLVACYELGHQPLAVAWPAAFLERLGYRPATLDVSVEPFDAEAVKRARLVAISVPVHTALRLGVAVAERVRAVNPGAHLCFFGLHAPLNADFLLAHGADTVIGCEAEGPLAELARALAGGEAGPVPGVSRAGARAGPYLAKLPFPVPSRAGLPSLKKYAHLERDGGRELAGYVEASRGCRHHCRHCPIPPVYGGRFFVVPREVCLADIRQLVRAGATHVTFGDPDFLNGPGHALPG